MPRTINEQLAEMAAREAPESLNEHDLADRLVRSPRAVRFGAIVVLAVVLIEAFKAFDFLHGLVGVGALVALGIFGAVVLYRLFRGFDERAGEDLAD